MRVRAIAVSLFVALPGLAVIVSAPAGATHPVTPSATVELRTAGGVSSGTVKLSTVSGGSRLEVTATGLTPGFHGFHVHATGSCDGSTTPPFTSAGAHFDTAGRSHGAHAADLPPLLAGADGTARADLVTDAFTVADLMPEGGNRSFVVHAAPDNLANIPTRYRHGAFADTETGPDTATLATGDSGGRVLCGVVATSTAAAAALPPVGAASASAALRTAAGTSAGTVTLRQLADRIEVRGTITGLTAGFHGIHLHTVGSCDGSTTPPFTSAGGHLVGGGGSHGSHGGDLPALRVRADGTVNLDVDSSAVSMDTLFDADGAALVVHAAPDNLANIPTRYRHGALGAGETGPDAATLATGDSGGRTLCGVVRNTAGAYRATTPTRLLDTRSSGGALTNGNSTVVRVVPVGTTTPYDGAVLTLTAVGPTANTSFSIGAAALPALRAPRGQVTAATVIAPLSSDGTVTIQTAGGPSHLLVDVSGLYTTESPIGAGRYAAVTPSRLVTGATLGAGSAANVVVAGRGGVPTSGVAGVVLTLTATRPTASTHLTVHPSGSARPGTSALNLRVGQTRAATVIAPLGADGAVTIFNSAGSLTYLVDVVGWYSAGGTAGGRVVTLPSRAVRSTDDPASPPLRLVAATPTDVVLAGRAGIPARGARAVVLGVTVSTTSSRSHLTVFPTGTTTPATSDLNWLAGETLSTTVVVPLGADGKVRFLASGGTADLLLEVRGYVDAGPV